MGKFLQFLKESDKLDLYQRGQLALQGGDYSSALAHFRAYVPGKNRRRDFEVSKLIIMLKKKVSLPSVKESYDQLYGAD